MTTPRANSGANHVESHRCEHCGGDPAGVVVTKRVVTVTYEQHAADCPMLRELGR